MVSNLKGPLHNLPTILRFKEVRSLLFYCAHEPGQNVHTQRVNEKLTGLITDNPDIFMIQL